MQMNGCIGSSIVQDSTEKHWSEVSLSGVKTGSIVKVVNHVLLQQQLQCSAQLVGSKFVWSENWQYCTEVVCNHMYGVIATSSSVLYCMFCVF